MAENVKKLKEPLRYLHLVQHFLKVLFYHGGHESKVMKFSFNSLECDVQLLKALTISLHILWNKEKLSKYYKILFKKMDGKLKVRVRISFIGF